MAMFNSHLSLPEAKCETEGPGWCPKTFLWDDQFTFSCRKSKVFAVNIPLWVASAQGFTTKRATVL